MTGKEYMVHNSGIPGESMELIHEMKNTENENQYTVSCMPKLILYSEKEIDLLSKGENRNNTA